MPRRLRWIDKSVAGPGTGLTVILEVRPPKGEVWQVRELFAYHTDTSNRALQWLTWGGTKDNPAFDAYPTRYPDYTAASLAVGLAANTPYPVGSFLSATHDTPQALPILTHYLTVSCAFAEVDTAKLCVIKGIVEVFPESVEVTP